MPEPVGYEVYFSARVPPAMRDWADDWVKTKVLEYRLDHAKDLGQGLTFLPPVDVTFDSYWWQRFGEPLQYVSLAYK